MLSRNMVFSGVSMLVMILTLHNWKTVVLWCWLSCGCPLTEDCDGQLSVTNHWWTLHRTQTAQWMRRSPCLELSIRYTKVSGDSYNYISFYHYPLLWMLLPGLIGAKLETKKGWILTNWLWWALVDCWVWQHWVSMPSGDNEQLDINQYRKLSTLSFWSEKKKMLAEPGQSVVSPTVMCVGMQGHMLHNPFKVDNLTTHHWVLALSPSSILPNIKVWSQGRVHS